MLYFMAAARIETRDPYRPMQSHFKVVSIGSCSGLSRKTEKNGLLKVGRKQKLTFKEDLPTIHVGESIEVEDIPF